ncbi:MAG: hypothetical protein JXA49_01870 [Actinobacteria bacterium]|nr:hypothetical protein [Actinomycetota bacterium]
MRTLFRSNIIIASVILFIIFTGISMLLFPGGSYGNDPARGFSFTENYFSDLGATRTCSERTNMVSMVLFVTAVLLFGLSLFLFTFNIRVITEKRGRFSTLGKASIAFGIISGLAFIAIAAAPRNHFPNFHMILVDFTFGTLLIYLIIVVFLQTANGWNRTCIALNAVSVFILGGYMLLLFLKPDIDTAGGLRMQVVCQNIAVYSSIINLSLQACGTMRYLLSPEYDNNTAGV